MQVLIKFTFTIFPKYEVTGYIAFTKRYAYNNLWHKDEIEGMKKITAKMERKKVLQNEWMSILA